MAHRIADGGRLVNRGQTLEFRFNNKAYPGFEGDTLASALLANDVVLVGRSFKYHRPRGIVASGAEEPNALVGLGEGARFEPNQRMTTTELFGGLVSQPQNAWPSLDYDIGAVNKLLSRFFPAGFYYKTFMAPKAAWKHLFEPIIRKAAGLGNAPTEADVDRYEYFYAYTDVIVAGGGVAGLTAARRAAEAGAKVLLCEQTAHWGGRALVDDIEIDGKAGPEWVAEQVAALEAMENVTMRLRSMVSGVYDHGYVLVYERVADHTPGDGRPRHRLWRTRTEQVISATGAIERPLSFAGNDIPGVMLAAAVRDYVELYGVAPGKRTVVVANNDDAYRTAISLAKNGLEVSAIVDPRPEGAGELAQEAVRLGLRVLNGQAIAKVHGGKRVTGVEICEANGKGDNTKRIACDCVAMSGGWSPVVHLWSHCGGKLNWDEERVMFRPDHDRAPTSDKGQPFVAAAGSSDGALGTNEVLASAIVAADKALSQIGREAAAGTDVPATKEFAANATLPVWVMPTNAKIQLRMKAFLDPQNDVKVSDVQLAAREGYESVEHTKRYTTLGMATDQGKLSNINGLAILADTLGAHIPDVGTTTFRPPYTPISMGAIAGDARGPLFKPTRKSPMDSWSDENHAFWEPVSDWRRPYTYQRPGEKVKEAVEREILATRNSVGMLDASTLGKIIVKGPDAGKFMDMMYTNMMSNLKVGRCRYGLMCNENGFLFDDGVVARLSEDTWLCHTTSGGSDRVHAWMEEWLQTEWWDFKVYTANVTEQYAQIAVVGPNARKVLEKLGGMDVSKENFKFMDWKEGELAGIPARIHFISFSGELSYEIAVPASYGQAFWDKIREAGAEFDITPYGTEALHVMRAEKGFIMIGDETDGTVIPQDLNMSWAVSKKKEDFIGKRAHTRADLTREDRKQLVGLEVLDGKTVLPDGAHAVDGKRANGLAKMIGHVTSTYWSPTLRQPIAMALIEGGSKRMGQVLDFPVSEHETIRARVVDPVFYDKEGAKQNV